jgi:hypothetical protein
LCSIAAQAPKDEITPEETARVNAIAHKFADRMFVTKNIEPLINEFFVKDFIKRGLTNPKDSWDGAMIEGKLARQLPERDLRRFFIAERNWYFLLQIYLCSIASALDDDGEIKWAKNEDCVRLLSLLKKDPNMKFSTAEFSDDELEREFPVRTKEKFLSLLRSFERFVPIIKRHVISTKAGTTDQWKETMDYWTKRFNYYHPSALNDDDDPRYGTQPQTRRFTVNVPSFTLVLIKLRGKIKIVDAFPHTD